MIRKGRVIRQEPLRSARSPKFSTETERLLLLGQRLAAHAPVFPDRVDDFVTLSSSRRRFSVDQMYAEMTWMPSYTHQSRTFRVWKSPTT